MRERRDSEQVYFRQLPGGGFVAIEVIFSRTLFGRRKYRGEVLVERRMAVERRVGHEPPTVAYAEGDSIATIFHKLFPLAQSNAAVAVKCLECSPHSVQTGARADRMAVEGTATAAREVEASATEPS